MAIKLSKESQEIISSLGTQFKDLKLAEFQEEVELTGLVTWLGTSITPEDDKHAVFLARVRASLLRDLVTHYKPQANTQSEVVGQMAKAKFALLAIAGTIFFACEGFGSITTMLGIFSSAPTFPIFLAATAFSFLSIVAFCSYDLVEISRRLGVEFTTTPKLLDALHEEFKQIKALRNAIGGVSVNHAESQKHLDLVNMLIKRHLALEGERKKLIEALNNPYLKAVKIMTAAIVGTIFFSGGFFAGQTAALYIAELFLAPMATTAFPIVLASLIVGVTAFSIYWYAEQSGIENLICRWMHLDKEKIDYLCDQKKVKVETNKLHKLKLKLEKDIDTTKEIEGLKDLVEKEKTITNNSMVTKHGIFRAPPPLKRSLSLGDLRDSSSIQLEFRYSI
jgi:hypothetical protein